MTYIEYAGIYFLFMSFFMAYMIGFLEQDEIINNNKKPQIHWVILIALIWPVAIFILALVLIAMVGFVLGTWTIGRKR